MTRFTRKKIDSRDSHIFIEFLQFFLLYRKVTGMDVKELYHSYNAIMICTTKETPMNQYLSTKKVLKFNLAYTQQRKKKVESRHCKGKSVNNVPYI